MLLIASEGLHTNSTNGWIRKRAHLDSPIRINCKKEASDQNQQCSSKVYMGIDPDASGAIGLLAIEKVHEEMIYSDVRVIDMPCVIQIINGKKRR